MTVNTSTNASVLGIDPLTRAYGLGTSTTLIGHYVTLNTSNLNASNASSWNSVNLTLYYNTSLISPAQAATLRIYWYNRNNGTWWPLGPGINPLPNLTSMGGPKVLYSVLNTTGGYVLVTVNHLSDYAMGADPELSISANPTAVTVGRPTDVTYTITGAED